MYFVFNIHYKQDWKEFDNMTRDFIMGEGSAVQLTTSLYDYELAMEDEIEGKRWYRSKERLAGVNPFASYMMNKKWWLEEEFNNHMLRFQQVPELLDCFLG